MPTDLKMWARMSIMLDNLTYFIWFWSAFFWVFFNFISVFREQSLRVEISVMIGATVFLQVISWTLVILASLRANKHSYEQASELSQLSLANIWHSNQLFYLAAPLQFYSILMGFLDYLRNKQYKEDISFWAGGDRGQISTLMVKWWTLAILLAALFVWVYALFVPGVSDNAKAAAVTFTFIAADVLHPCTYLWLDKSEDAWKKVQDKWLLDREKYNGLERPKTTHMPLLTKMTTLSWYSSKLRRAILNRTTVSFFMYLGPTQQVLFPIMVLVLPELGLSASFNILAKSSTK